MFLVPYAEGFAMWSPLGSVLCSRTQNSDVPASGSDSWLVSSSMIIPLCGLVWVVHSPMVQDLVGTNLLPQ